MMAHKLARGTSFLFMTTSSSPKVRPVTTAIVRSQARKNIDERVRTSQNQNSAHSPFIAHPSVAISSPIIDGPHRRRPTAGVMPRSGYDSTNMRMAANPRPAGSASGTGKPGNDNKPNSVGNSDGGGSGSDRGVAGRPKGNGRDGDDNGSAKTPEQEPGQGNKNEAPTTKKTTDGVQIPWKDVHIPLDGRGWTFWL